MLTILSIVLLAIYAGFSEVCAHSAKIRGNSTAQFIRGLLKKGVEETGGEQNLATEFANVEAQAAPTQAPASTPATPAQPSTPAQS